MSTKIYCAFKFKQNRLNDFINIANELVFKEEVKDWKTRFNRIPDTMVEEKLQLQKNEKITCLPHSVRSNISKFHIIHKDIDNMIRDSYKDPSIKDRLKETGLNLWLHKGYFYCIPWGHNGQVFNKMKLPNWVSDYSYWNNTDEPEGMDYSEWKKRGKTWDEICLENVEDWNARRLTHEIYSWKSFTSFFDYNLIIQKKLKLYKYLIGF